MLGKIGLIIGIVVLAAIAVLVFILLRKRKKRWLKMNQAAFEILKEEALSDSLKNTEDMSENKTLYRLENPRMLLIEGKNLQRKLGLVFSPREHVIIGRNPKESTICLKDPFISNQHCEILTDAGGTWIKDLGSSNGTNVLRYGKLYGLGEGDALLLKNKDKIVLGNNKFTVRFFHIDKRYLKEE